MRIAVIGAGNVGKAVGQKWAAAGHDVRYGVRNPADAKHASLAVATVGEAVRDAAAVLFAGDDPSRRADVASPLRDLGFDPVDAGPLSSARLLEPLAMLWIDLAMKRGQGRNAAFALMHRA